MAGPQECTVTSVAGSRFDLWGKQLPRCRCCDRDSLLLSLASNKSVLHLGAADSPFTAEAAAKGRLLHMKLKGVVKELCGLDSDSEAVDLLRREYGIADIEIGDACQPAAILGKRRFDIVLCCDIVEHVNDPCALLAGVRSAIRPGGQIVVTTINALAAKPFLRGLIGSREAVHPQHIAYYSFGTLGSLMDRAGYDVTGYTTFAYNTTSRLASYLFSTVFRINANVADGILMLGTPQT